MHGARGVLHDLGVTFNKDVHRSYGILCFHLTFRASAMAMQAKMEMAREMVLGFALCRVYHIFGCLSAGSDSHTTRSISSKLNSPRPSARLRQRGGVVPSPTDLKPSSKF